MNRNQGLGRFRTKVLEKQVVFTRQLPGHVPKLVLSLFIPGSRCIVDIVEGFREVLLKKNGNLHVSPSIKALVDVLVVFGEGRREGKNGTKESGGEE